ncbi:MAG: type I phosphomannose isomerase catalytic subunit [Sphingomicrobium sp.]
MILHTIEVEKPWGVDRLPAGFADNAGRRIGEIWFDRPGGSLPLLVKWLFTSERLSIQVHPDDAQAAERGQPSGKEECWVIVAAEADARLGIGTIEPLSPERLREASLSGEIEHLMDWKQVAPGDYFYIPAGTVHAIGAGIALVEVQQNADITYRLYDYGRPRELHLDEGIAVSKAAPYADPRSGRMSTDTAVEQLVDGPHFRLWQARGAAIGGLVAGDEPCWVVPLAGEMSAGGNPARTGDCLYLLRGEQLVAGDGAHALVAKVGR